MGWNASNEQKSNSPTKKGPNSRAMNGNGAKGSAPVDNQPAFVTAKVEANTNQQDAAQKEDKNKKLARRQSEKRRKKKEKLRKSQKEKQELKEIEVEKEKERQKEMDSPNAKMKKKLGYKPMVISDAPKPKQIDIKELSDKEFEKLKGALFVKTMKYQLQLAGDYQDSLEERVARLLTNDLGETLRTEVSFSLIQEFKKFMYLVALDVLDRKRSTEMSSEMYYKDKLNNRMCFSSQYHPHYIIDLVWRFIIQEGQIYADFCEAICGWFIDRLSPRVDMKATLSRYNSAKNKIEKYEQLLHPYWGLWPIINSTIQLEVDYDYDMLLHTKEKDFELMKLREKIQKEKIDQVKSVKVRSILEAWKKENLNEFDEIEDLLIDEDIDFSKYSKRKKVDFKDVYDRLLNYKFSERFTKPICMMFMLSEAAGEEFIGEYKKFLFIYYLTEGTCSPSFEIDSFWDIHYASTKDYREFCSEIFGVFLQSRNYDYNQKGIKNRTKEYKKTLKIYEELFGDEPDEILWESPVDLTINSKNGFQHVNLFKYVCFSIYSNIQNGLEYKNTLRRDKYEFYDRFAPETIDQINRKNELKFLAAKGDTQFERLAYHRTVNDKSSLDESEEREEAEALAESTVRSGSHADTSFSGFDEHEDGAGYKTDRIKSNIDRKSATNESKNKKDSRSVADQAEESKEKKVIFDPVLTKGGFKFLPTYYDTLIFDKEDLIDWMENDLYKDYIHKGSTRFRDIFDVAILSRADVEVLFFDKIESRDELNIHKSIQSLKKEDVNFEFKKSDVQDDSKSSDSGKFKTNRDSESGNSSSVLEESSELSNSDESDESSESSEDNQEPSSYEDSVDSTSG